MGACIGLFLLFAAVTGHPPSLPDLYPLNEMAGGLSASYLHPGESTTLRDWLLQNRGDAAGAFKVRVVLSKDRIVSADDAVLFAATLVGVSSTSSTPMAGTTFSVGDRRGGIYWVGIVVDADNEVEESNETNNALWLELNIITPIDADVIITAGALGAVAVGDLTKPDYAPLSGPVPVAPDGDLIVGGSVTNDGSAVANGVNVGYYMSADEVFSATEDVPLRVTPGLKISAHSSTQLEPVSLRLDKEKWPPGDYYLLMVADVQDHVIERAGGRESNNVKARRIRVLNVPSEDAAVFRVRARYWLGGGENNGTDNGTHASLNHENTTRMDYARDDFKPGSSDAFDLVLDNVRTLRDITYLDLKVDGHDGLCLSRVTLEVNTVQYADMPFPGCKWIEGDAVRLFNYIQLRVSPDWGKQPALGSLFTMKREDVSSLIQAHIGNELGARFHKNLKARICVRGHCSSEVPAGSVAGYVRWGHYRGDEHITVEQASASSLHINLDMYLDLDNLPDTDLDVDFKLEFDCSAGTLELNANEVEVTVDSDWKTLVQDWVFDRIINKRVKGSIKRQLQDALAAASPQAGVAGLCPTVLANGDLKWE